jgi:hypothetical protein
MDYSENFLTEKQIEKVIDLPFSAFNEMLDRYVYLKGLVLGEEKKITYVDGYFVIGASEHSCVEYTLDQIEDGYHIAEPDMPDNESLVSVNVTEFSNKDDLLGEEVFLKRAQDIDVVWYSYIQLCQLMKKLGCPEPKCLTELAKKEYAYDIELVNQKSNFSLSDASKIAANVYKTSIRSNVQQQYMPNIIALIHHYLELLSDCIKGTNQHGFKLHTVELWCIEDDRYGEGASYSYDNGTYLNQKVTLDSKLTIISKREFVRWCEYENVDTGLTLENRDFEESIEALKAENKKLKAQVCPQQTSPNNDSEKVKQLNREIEQLREELDSVKANSFPIMTSHLKAALSAQKKYWLNYDVHHLPLQKNIQYHIQEVLNIDLKTDNRLSKSLSVAIQPDDIKRK